MNFRGRVLSVALTIATVLSFAAFVLLLLSEECGSRGAAAKAKQTARARVATAAAEIGGQLRKLTVLADGVARDLGSGALQKNDLDARLKREAEATSPKVFAVGAFFAPFAFDPQRKLYGVVFRRRAGQYTRIQVEEIYDYTARSFEWYRSTLESGATWHEPFFGRASESLISPYCTAFTLTGSTAPSGIICVTYSLDDVRGLVDSLHLGQTGYGFLLSRQGALLAHPEREYVRNAAKLAEIAEARRDAKLRVFAERAIRGERGDMDDRDLVTGERTWTFQEPVPSTGWSLVTVVLPDELLSRGTHLRHSAVMLVALAVVLAISAMLRFIVRRYESAAVLWSAAVFASSVFITGIGTLWWIERSVTSGRDRVLLVDQAGVANFVADRERRAEKTHLLPPARLPTGIFVQSIAFTTPHTVAVSGYVWQKYDMRTLRGLEQGIVLPEWVPEQDVLQEAYRRIEGNVEIVGWFFKATLREPADYRKFPVDSHEIRIRLWPKVRDANVILVPDLDAYRYVIPTSLPGLERGFMLPGWRVTRVFFAYSTHDYGTDFGLATVGASEGHPELSLYVAIERNLVDAIISNLVPLFVAALMLFAMLIIDTRDQTKAKRFGFSTSTVLSTSAALLFVMLLAHVQIRSQIASQQIMYLEYFYFTSYLAIVGVSLNAFLLAASFCPRVIAYRDNLIPKLLFWPALWGVLFVITLGTMY